MRNYNTEHNPENDQNDLMPRLEALINSLVAKALLVLLGVFLGYLWAFVALGETLRATTG